MADVEFGSDHHPLPHQNNNNNDGEQQPHTPHPRPMSTASSQLSFSDHIGDDGGGEADEDNSSLIHHNQFGATNPGSSTCSSSFNLHRQSSSGSQHEGQNPHPPHGNNPPTASSILKAVNGTGDHGLGISNSLAKTTTISTIAMESNTSATSKCSPTRLVIALLQTPHQALHLKIIELSPNLLKLPDNLPEAEDYLKNHSQVIKNLQSKQSPVEELLRQADSLIATQKPRAEVYAAMADSLGQTWKDLNTILDERRIVIQLAYNCHKVIQSCVDRMNELHTAYSKFNYVPTIEEQCVQGGTPQDVAASLRKLKEDRADVLKYVSQALDVCQQLLNKITDFNSSIDSRQLFLKRDVDFATKQVHRWLERLHDRRMILEERLKTKREQFEEMADFLLHDKEMSGLLQELDRLRKASQEFSLGHSVQSAESQRDELEKMVREMKMLQERALLTARKLEQNGQSTKGRFYQRSGLKQKIYDILGTVNDLITESIDFELSLVDAKEFFHLADLANAKLDELASSSSSSGAAAGSSESTRVLPKSQINSLTFDALSKGQVLLDSLGWDSARTRGVRAVYEELNKRKAVIQDEIEHLELLDEYNHFLEKVNQAYQNILNVESSTVRQPKTLPVDLHLVSKFREEHERTLEELSHKTNFKELLSTLEQIYPGLSEEEKISTERKVDQLKSLSNLLVELILQRIWLAGEWHKILELDRNEWSILGMPVGSSSGKEISKRIHDVGENIGRLYGPIREQLNEVHSSDPDLITSKMEAKMEELIKKYRSREQELAAVHRIREICQAYKVKLDHHLLGNPDTISKDGLSSVDTTATTGEPSYFPVLNESLVAATLRTGERTSLALERIVREQLREKLSGTLQNFFQPLLTNFRQEILEAQESLVGSQLLEKTTEEISWERYFERLKESYVKVTRELESYLIQLGQLSREVEGRLEGGVIDSYSVEGIEQELNELSHFRSELKRRMDQEVKPGLDHILSIVGHEEPPIQAEQEDHTIRTLTSTILGEQLDSSISQKQDNLTRQLTEKMIHNDLDMINRTLNELISELEHPCNYGNNLRDAQTYLASFERFEKTVETLRDKLSRLLTTAGMSETDVKAQNLLGKLNQLVDRKGKRRELILLSLEYFKLIEKSYEHYDKVNSEINDIITKSKSPNIKIEDIEGLLRQLESLKGKEQEQERRLDEIERIAKIIFDVSLEGEAKQHYPLRDQSAKMSGEISRVESDLTSLLGIIKKSQSEPVVKVAQVPSAFELELESQILAEQLPKTKFEKRVAAPPVQSEARKEPQELVEVMEELIVPTRVVRRPTSQEICTQTSMLMDEDELEAKTREYLKEKERMTVAVLEVLRQSMSPLPPHPQTVEKETQFEEMEVVQRKTEKVDRDALTQTVEERRRSFPTQTEEIFVRKGVEMSTETDEGQIFLEEAAALIQQHQQRPSSRECVNPMFVQPLKDLVVNEGDKVVLECKTTGRIYKLVWLKDGLEIQNNPDYKTDFLDGSTARLTIDEVLPEDSAIFTCRAYSEGANVMVETSGRLTIREPVMSLLVAPQFLPHLPTFVGEHGKPHVIQVKVEGNPLPTVQWFKDGQCIDTSPDYIITFNNGLCEVQFDELVKDMDDGKYTCVGTNKLGDCETTVELQITGDVDISRKLSRLPPRIIHALPKNLMSRAGQRVKLECEFESHTDFTVIWIKDDNKILTKTNSSAEITTQGDTSTLIFNEAYPVNSGKYTVLIRNAGGECQSDCQIIVKGLLPAETSDSELNISDSEAIKPSIKMPLKDVRGRVGDTLRLDCVIIGNPEPEVIWYKNAVPLKESPNHQLLFTGDKCSVVINFADLSDNGIYSVSALNNCGEAGSKCQVFVFEKSPEVFESKPVQRPTFIKMIQDEMVNAGSDFSLIVELAPDLDNPNVVTDVTWWKNNSQLLPDLDGIQLSRDGLQHRLYFKEVGLQDKGNYMVKAVNSGGDAKCFGCLIVKENFERVVDDEQVSVKEPVPAPTVQPPKQTVTPPPTAPPVQKVAVARTITKPPRFVIPLEGKMVDEGDKDVSIKCKIAASPPATVKWTKNNSAEPLQPSADSNMRLFYNERNGEIELTLSTVNVKDGGRYTCHASNEHGLASTVSDLVVKKTTFPPVFSKRLQSLTMEEGKRIYMEVDVYGKPSPQIKWELNGQPITQNAGEGITIKSDSPTRHSLIIASGNKDKYSGVYKVIAKNEAGEATCSCTVSIIGKTDSSSAVEAMFVPPPSKIVQMATAPVTPSESKVSTENQSSSLVRKDDQSSSVMESSVTTTTIYTSSEEHKYESRVTQVISPVPAPDINSLAVVRHPQIQASAPPTTLVKTQDVVSLPKPTRMEMDDHGLIPGPEPEILVAPPPTLPSAWAMSTNQVIEKVKKLEEETAEAAASPQVEGPIGGVRIIPIHRSEPSPPPPLAKTGISASPIFSQQFEPIDLGEPPKIEPILPPIISPGPYEGFMMSEPPKISHDATSSVSKDSYHVGGTFVQKEERHEEQRSSSQMSYIRPSKFVPEKMRESDHESEVESTVIPPKWTPPPVIHATITMPVSTTSAFVSITPTSTFYSSPGTEQQRAPLRQQPRPSDPGGVKSIAKLWPPQGTTLETTQTISSTSTTNIESAKMQTLSTGGTSVPPGLSRLSPIGVPSERSARSPTPNKEALEMDKLWSKPIRFASPVNVPQTSIPTQPSGVLSPTSTMKKPKPEVPPKPSSSSPWLKRTTPTPYSPVSSPLPSISPHPTKPEVPPKPSYLKSASPYSPLTSPQPSSRPVSATPGVDQGNKESLYYVSTVSTPRTTPIPPQILAGWTSPLPSTPEVPTDQSYSSAFHEKREYFENTTTQSSSYRMEEMSSSSHKQFSKATSSTSPRPHGITSPTFMDFHPSGVSLLDQSFLPPPGEPPVFMYAPPPPKTSVSPSFSSMSSSKSSTFMQSPSTGITTTTIPSSLPSSGKRQVNLSKEDTMSMMRMSTSTSKIESSRQQPPPPPKLTKPIVIVSSGDDDEKVRSSSTATASSLVKLTWEEDLSSGAGTMAVVPFRRRQDVPYIRPTKFIPVLDYSSASGLEESGDDGEGGIKAKWKPMEGDQDALSRDTWRKVTYQVPSRRRDSLTSLVDKSMLEMNKQFKSNISQLSQGLCYNRMDRNIQSDLSGVGGGRKDNGTEYKPSADKEQGGGEASSSNVEDANPLIYFKYDFGYEFGIATPRNARASSEPLTKKCLPASERPTSWMDGEGDAPIVLPIIHETTTLKGDDKGKM